MIVRCFPFQVWVNPGAARDQVGLPSMESNKIALFYGPAHLSVPSLVSLMDVPTDADVPVVQLTSSMPSPAAATPVPVSVLFSKEVEGFTALGLALTGGTVMDFTTTTSLLHSTSN